MAWVLYTDMAGFLSLMVDVDDRTLFADVANVVQVDRLINLMGYNEFAKLMADLDVNGDPQTAKYIALMNGGDYTIGTDTYRNRGAKEMLKYFTFFEFKKRMAISHTGAGNAALMSENATRVGLTGVDYKMQNIGVDIYDEVAYWMQNNETHDFDDLVTVTTVKENVWGI